MDDGGAGGGKFSPDPAPTAGTAAATLSVDVTTIFGMLLLAFAFLRLSRFFRLFSSSFQIINL